MTCHNFGKILENPFLSKCRPRACNLIEKGVQRRYFSINFMKFFRKGF